MLPESHPVISKALSSISEPTASLSRSRRVTCSNSSNKTTYIVYEKRTYIIKHSTKYHTKSTIRLRSIAYLNDKIGQENQFGVYTGIDCC